MKDYMTPTEIIAAHPNCGYNAREIGYMLMLKLLEGRKVGNSCVVSVTSFLSILEYKKENGLTKY